MYHQHVQRVTGESQQRLIQKIFPESSPSAWLPAVFPRSSVANRAPLVSLLPTALNSIHEIGWFAAISAGDASVKLYWPQV